MSFWRYFSEGPGGPETGWKTAKLIAAAVIVFLIVPVLLYNLIKWDPVIHVSEDGDPVTLGVWVVLGLYWVGAYYAYGKWKAERRLNRFEDSNFRLWRKVRELQEMELHEEANRLRDALNESEGERDGQ